jgi:hypothetical protein
MSAFCDSEATRLHETFSCLESPNHPMPHKGSLVPVPCSVCGGLEQHSDTCADGDSTSDACPFEVQWDDGDTEPRLVLWASGATA